MNPIYKGIVFQFGLVFVVAAAAAAPQFIDQQGFVSPGKSLTYVVSQRTEQDDIGNYEFGYALSDGQKVCCAVIHTSDI